MSRHSHWAKIKRAKGADDAKKGAAFTKLSRAITIAAKEKGTDPATNFKLRLAIDAARAENMPKDTIERAIARASGSAGEGDLSEVTYEVIGPGGVSILIDAVTDNKNRTSGNIKAILAKHGGATASVKWQFEQKGIIRLSLEGGGLEGVAIDELQLQLIDQGAEDVKTEEGGMTIYIAPERLQAMVDFLLAKAITPAYSGIDWIPKTTVPVTDPAARAALDTILEALDADDDVANYATNEA